MKIYKSSTPELQLKKVDGTISKVQLKTSKDGADFLREIYDSEQLEICEWFIVVYLNRANNTIGYFKASQGGITGTVVDVRLILKKALDCYATSMIISHNHPSGNLTPSSADIELTKKLKAGASIMDIKLIDHIILSTDSHYSFGDEGLI